MILQLHFVNTSSEIIYQINFKKKIEDIAQTFEEYHFIKYFQKRLKGREKENGIKLKMWVKPGAKMLVIAWTLMKKKTEFDPAHLK